MQEQFNISTNTIGDLHDFCLVVQVGSDYFSYCIYNPFEKKLLKLKRYSFPNCTTGVLDNILQNDIILDNSFQKIIIWLDFDFTTLLPASLATNDAASLMYLENADQQDHIITEYLKQGDIANLYSVPPAILSWLVQHFPSSGFLHKHSALIQNIHDFPVDGLIRIEILDHSFTVIVFKENKLLLAKDYCYTVPDDIVFYLLKISEVFGFSQENVELQVSGLIDVESKIYRALYDYFLKVNLKPVSWIDTVSETPAHYFTSLNELALCGLLQEV